MVEIMTLQSPHKLLKNLGALSEYAKCSKSSTKKLKSLPGYDRMVKKQSHATDPSKITFILIQYITPLGFFPNTVP
jgi:hypothetical protein